MFTRSPIFIRIQNYGQQFMGDTPSSAWWLIMAPGLALTAVALAILLWPELLAYMVASVLLLTGVTLIVWGWRMRRAVQRWQPPRSTVDHPQW